MNIGGFMDSKRLFSSLEKLNFVRVSRTEEERKAAQIILKEIEDAGDRRCRWTRIY